MVHYKLTYFDGRGAGEIIRQVLALGEQKFEDVRLSDEEWEKYKDSNFSPILQQILEMPFRQLPVFEEDGKQLAQSYTIARYLARKYGFAGKTAWEEAQVDALADQWKDFRQSIYPLLSVILGYTEGDLSKLKEEHLSTIKQNFTYFVNAIKKGCCGFLVGNSVTYVDLPVAEFTQSILDKDPSLLDGFPELIEHKKKVHDVPQIKKWRETRPKSDW